VRESVGGDAQDMTPLLAYPHQPDSGPRLDNHVNNDLVPALGVSVEIELKMDWQGCEKV